MKVNNIMKGALWDGSDIQNYYTSVSYKVSCSFVI